MSAARPPSKPGRGGTIRMGTVDHPSTVEPPSLVIPPSPVIPPSVVVPPSQVDTPNDEDTPVEAPKFDLDDLRREAAEEARRVTGAHPIVGGAAPSPAVVTSTGSRSLRLPEEGDRVGQYTVIRKLSEGGQAKVYEIQHMLLKERRALKVLRPEHAENPVSVDRFVAEFRVMFELNGHPNLVAAHEIGFQEGLGHYIVMEYLEGESLRASMTNRLKKGARVPYELALSIVVQVAETLHMTHALGFIHRDIKPENIFLVPTGPSSLRVVVLDWGCAKSKHGPRTSHQDHADATALYMSPEQVGRAHVTGQSDQFSLNHVLQELLHEHAFADAIRENPLSPHLYMAWQRWTRIEPLPPHLAPPSLAKIVTRAFSREPSERFETMQAYARALRAVVDSGELPLGMRKSVARPTAPRSGVVPTQFVGRPLVPLAPSPVALATGHDRRTPKRQLPAFETFGEPSLFVIHPPALYGLRFELGKSGIVGRASDEADIVIDDPSVSARHLRYSHIGGSGNETVYGVEDLDSTHGVEIAHDPTRARARSMIVGETVRLGDVFAVIAPPGDPRHPEPLSRPADAPMTDCAPEDESRRDDDAADDSALERAERIAAYERAGRFRAVVTVLVGFLGTLLVAFVIMSLLGVFGPSILHRSPR